MKKNTSSQVVGAQLVSATDGSNVTSGTTTVYVLGDGGTQATGTVGSGAATHEGHGFWTYAPAQAETNYDHVAFTFENTSAVTASVQIYTSFPQTGDNYARIGSPIGGVSIANDLSGIYGSLVLRTGTAQAGASTSITLDASASSTNDLYKDSFIITTSGTGTMQARSITAYNGTTKVATVAPAWATTPDNTTTFAVRAAAQPTGVQGSVTGSVASVSGAVGSVTGAVGSVTGAVGSVTGSVGSVTARVTANTDQLAGQTVTAAAGVTFPTSVASPTNITAGTITTVTNLTNAPTAGDLTATMKTSVTTAATAATPIAASVSGAVGSVASGGITSGSFAAGAINAAAIAADAITDAKVASDVTIASVTGAVGSVASGGITAASFATDAVDANALKADAVAEIQSGLATTTALTTVGTNVSAVKLVTDRLDGMIEDAHSPTQRRFTAVALEEAPSSGTAPTVTAIADEVQTRTIAAVTSVTSIAAGGITASSIATDAIDADALAADAVTEIQSGLSTLNAAGVRTAVGLGSANLDTQLSGIQSDADDIQTRLPATLVSGRMDASVGAMAAGVVTAAAIATNAIDADALASDAVTEIQSGLSTLNAAGVRSAVGLGSANLDTQLGAIDDVTDLLGQMLEQDASGPPRFSEDALSRLWAHIVESGYTADEFMRGFAAAMFGKASGMATPTGVFRDTGDTKDRITSTTDSSGNRSAITLDLTP